MHKLDGIEVQSLVVLDTSELLGFSQFSRVASAENTRSLPEMCRLLTKRGQEVPPGPTNDTPQ